MIADKFWTFDHKIGKIRKIWSQTLILEGASNFALTYCRKTRLVFYYYKLSTIQLGSCRYILRPEHCFSIWKNLKSAMSQNLFVVKHQQKSWYNSFISNMFLNVYTKGLTFWTYFINRLPFSLRNVKGNKWHFSNVL